MARVLVSVVALAAMLSTGLASAAAPSLTLVPTSVKRGQTVVIRGSVDGGCAAGDTVFVISRAFVHTHDFAGLPAVPARVRRGGSFRVTTRIPATKRPARYQVTARCGGGNLGLVKHLTVRR